MFSRIAAVAARRASSARDLAFTTSPRLSPSPRFPTSATLRRPLSSTPPSGLTPEELSLYQKLTEFEASHEQELQKIRESITAMVAETEKKLGDAASSGKKAVRVRVTALGALTLSTLYLLHESLTAAKERKVEKDAKEDNAAPSLHKAADALMEAAAALTKAAVGPAAKEEAVEQVKVDAGPAAKEAAVEQPSKGSQA